MKNYKAIFKTKWGELRLFFIMLFGWIKNVYILFFGSIKRPYLFSGFRAYEIGKRFADKRTRKYSDKDQNGKEHGLFPYSDTSLIVLNKIELKRLKKAMPAKSWIALKMNPRKYIKRNSYYKTEYK